MESEDSVEELGPGGAFFVDYAALLGEAGDPRDGGPIGELLEGEWSWLYRRAIAGGRDLRCFTVGSFAYLWDVTSAAEPVPESRLMGLYGASQAPSRPRDASRMEGYPLRRREAGPTVHRGHGAGHSLGGPDEGYNLFAQSARVNLGKRWREMERYAASHLGTFLFVRCVYADAGATPSGLEYGLFREDCHLDVRRFRNM